MAEAVIPTASPMSSIETELKPLRATRSAAAVRIRCLRAGSRVLADRPAMGVTRAVRAPSAALGVLSPPAAAWAFSLVIGAVLRVAVYRQLLRAQQSGGQVHGARAEVLTKAFGLGVGPGGVGDAVAEQPDDHEVEGARVGQLVAVDAQPVGFGQQLTELRSRQVRTQPGERGRGAGPEADVGVAALVAGA